MKTLQPRTIADKYAQRYPDDMPALTAALRSGLSGTGEAVERYEAALMAYFGARHAIAVSSGGAALSVALAVSGVKPGTAVATTPVSPLCTVFPILFERARPVFVDCDRGHFGADLDSLADRWTADTRAVIDTPMWGDPTPGDRARALAHERGVPLILDLAHAHGTRLHGQHLSKFADLACFSTHERKPLATGEGGFILTDSPDLARRCRTYSRFGDLNGTDFGLNYKLGGLPAALGRSRLGHLDDQLAVRKRNAERLLAQLKHPAVRRATVIPGGEPNHYAVLLRLSFPDNRRFIDYLAAGGVPSDIARYGCRALYEWPALSAYRRTCPNAEAILASTTTIPVHPGVTADDIDYTAELINRYPG